MTHDDQLEALRSGPLHRFADWPDPSVPNWRAGVYTVWDKESFVYVGMAGRGMIAEAHLAEEALASNKQRGPRDRPNSHASGRRSGDQFCVYVFDRLVLETLNSDDVASAAAGGLSLDGATRTYIREHLGYRFVVTEDGKAALRLERSLQGGALGQRPLFNRAETLAPEWKQTVQPASPQARGSTALPAEQPARPACDPT